MPTLAVGEEGQGLSHPLIYTQTAEIYSIHEGAILGRVHSFTRILGVNTYQDRSICVIYIAAKMGCFSSKQEAETGHSFKQELRKSLRRRVVYFPALEDIFFPLNGYDHEFLTTNKAIKKLLVESQPPGSSTEPEIINVKELMADLDEEDEESEVKIKPGEEEEEEKRPIYNENSPLRSKSFDAVKECEAAVTDEKSKFQKLVLANPKDGMCNETKRKTTGRQLRTLSATIDLAVKKSLVGWDDDDENECITPKFGSFGAGGHCDGRDGGCEDGAGFYSELVAAVEAAMEKIRGEEEIVLQQMQDWICD